MLCNKPNSFIIESKVYNQTRGRFFSPLDSHNPEEDLEAVLGDRMQMIADRKMLTKTTGNIKDAQAWYKKHYEQQEEPQ